MRRRRWPSTRTAACSLRVAMWRAHSPRSSARAAFDEVGAPYDAARCVMAQSRLLAHAKKRKTSARTAALDAVARGVLATLGATDLET